MTNNRQTRRSFLKAAALGAAGAGFGLGTKAGNYATSAKSYRGILGANDRIRLGFIGMGRRGISLMNGFMDEADVEVAAVSDVFAPNLDRAGAAASDAKAYKDFRRVIDDPNIDAVVIGTPDHWHALPTVMACEAGKDVYVEKPTAVTVKESRAMVEAARRYDRVVQVGTQQRSDIHFQRARDIVRSGRLGPITFARTWIYSNSPVEGIGNPPNSVPPPTLDWDMWLGPAPKVPYNVNRFGIILDENSEHTRWATWRYFWDFGGGMMTDWGVHLLDIVLWAMGIGYPDKIAAAGGKFLLNDNRETPDTLQVTYRYPNFVCVFENRMMNSHNGHHGIAFHGTNATLEVSRGGYTLTPQPDSGVEPESMDPVDVERTHAGDFLDAMRARKTPIADIEDGHVSSAVAMLGNVAYRTGRQIVWDATREVAIDDPKADALLAFTYRTPWAL